MVRLEFSPGHNLANKVLQRDFFLPKPSPEFPSRAETVFKVELTSQSDKMWISQGFLCVRTFAMMKRERGRKCRVMEAKISRTKKNSKFEI